MTRHDVAVELVAEHGIPVFPCDADKKPRTAHGFKDATTNIERVDAWFLDSNSLIGVPTGERFFVVDVDPDGADWYRENASRLSCACVNSTRRGWHLVYQMPRGMEIATTTKNPVAGVDVRGTGGYVIWWPGEDLPSTGSLADIGPAPDWLLAALTAKPAKPKANGHDHQSDAGGIAEGARNDTLFRLGCKLRRHGLSAEALYAALKVENRKRCNPPLADAEVQTIAHSSGGYEPTPDSEPARPGTPLKPALTLRSALDCAGTLPQGDWLLRPFLERNATAIVYGDFGTYKSFLALDWALRVAIGLPAIGSDYFRESSPVVFISAEGRGLAKRLRAWCRHECSARDWQGVLRNVPLHIIEHAINLSEAEHARELVTAVEGLGITPGLVVIDTLSRNSNGEVESSTGDASAYLANLDQHLRTRFRCAILLVHHVGHVEKGRLRGPIVLAANTDVLIRVERTAPGEPAINVTVERLKDADLPAPISLRAVVVELGEVDEDGRPVTSLALEDNGAAVPAKREPSGKNQAALLAGLREWSRSNGDATHITNMDLQAIATRQGLTDRRRRGEGIEGLTKAGYLAAAVGGFRLEL